MERISQKREVQFQAQFYQKKSTYKRAGGLALLAGLVSAATAAYFYHYLTGHHDDVIRTYACTRNISLALLVGGGASLLVGSMDLASDPGVKKARLIAAKKQGAGYRELSQFLTDVECNIALQERIRACKNFSELNTLIPWEKVDEINRPKLKQLYIESIVDKGHIKPFANLPHKELLTKDEWSELMAYELSRNIAFIEDHGTAIIPYLNHTTKALYRKKVVWGPRLSNAVIQGKARHNALLRALAIPLGELGKQAMARLLSDLLTQKKRWAEIIELMPNAFSYVETEEQKEIIRAEVVDAFHQTTDLIGTYGLATLEGIDLPGKCTVQLRAKLLKHLKGKHYPELIQYQALWRKLGIRDAIISRLLDLSGSIAQILARHTKALFTSTLLMKHQRLKIAQTLSTEAEILKYGGLIRVNLKPMLQERWKNKTLKEVIQCEPELLRKYARPTPRRMKRFIAAQSNLDDLIWLPSDFFEKVETNSAVIQRLVDRFYYENPQAILNGPHELITKWGLVPSSEMQKKINATKQALEETLGTYVDAMSRVSEQCKAILAEFKQSLPEIEQPEPVTFSLTMWMSASISSQKAV